MKTLLIGLVLGMALFAMPAATEAAGLIPCGGTGQKACQACDIVTLEQNIIGFIIMVMGVIAVLIIVYAGVKLVTAGGNRHAMEEAKSMMTNMFIGYLLVLSAWLLIDYGMKALLDVGTFGVWNNINCVEQKVVGETAPMQIVMSSPVKVLTGVTGWVAGPSTGSMITSCTVLPGPPGAMAYDCSKQIATCKGNYSKATVNTGGSTVTCTADQYTAIGGSSGGGIQCAAGNSACSVSELQSLGLNSTQANVMSCIAMTESSGHPETRPYNEANPGSNSSACGTFQVVQSTWVGAATGDCSDFSQCTSARCNAQVAATLVRRNAYGDWTCITKTGVQCNPKASGCVAKYGG